jgi:hypothetical protein
MMAPVIHRVEGGAMLLYLVLAAMLLLIVLRPGAIMVPSAGGVQLLARQLYGRGQAISGATNASPAVITSNVHGLTNGNGVAIGGVGGNTNCNGLFTVYSVTTNTFNIASISGSTLTPIAGNGAYTSGGFWSLAGMENIDVRLYSSNTTAAEGSITSSFTEVSNGNGYTTGGQSLFSGLAQSGDNVWAVPATVSGGGTGGWASSLGTTSTNVPESTATPLVWNWTGTASAYGYFAVCHTSGTIAWAELFSAVQNYSSGGSLTITPRIGLTHS